MSFWAVSDLNDRSFQEAAGAFGPADARMPGFFRARPLRNKRTVNQSSLSRAGGVDLDIRDVSARNGQRLSRAVF
jgi:hypothetical protein